MQIVSNSQEDTMELGRKIASSLKQGMIIILTGDLGAGKTKFTEGVLDYFGLTDEISSPTFTIVNEYQTENLNIYHFDLYRLEDIDEFYSIGGEEYFDKGVCIVEWGEMIEHDIDQNYLKITFKYDEQYENKRIIDIEKIGDINIDLESLNNN